MKKQLLLAVLLLQSLFIFSQKQLDVMHIAYFQDSNYTDFYHYYTYDSNGNNIETQIFENDEINQDLFLKKIIYTYDANNNLIEKLTLDENLENIYKSIYSYNSNGINEINTFNWNSGNWAAENTVNYQYNSDGFLETKITSNINGDVIETDNYIYDANNNLIKIENDNVSIDYTYDSDGNLTNLVKNINDNGTIVEVYRYDEFYYDNTFSFNDLNLPINDDDFEFSEVYMNHMLTSAQRINDQSWEDTYGYFFTYSSVANVNNINKIVKSVKPNPFTDIITFEVDNNYNNIEIEILDIQGKIITTSNSNTVNTENLSSGVYFYKLYVNDLISTGKIIKK